MSPNEPFSQEEHQRKVLAWYAHLALNPGWKAYVWHRVNELAVENPEAFWDLPAKLLEAVPPKSSGAAALTGG